MSVTERRERGGSSEAAGRASHRRARVWVCVTREDPCEAHVGNAEQEAGARRRIGGRRGGKAWTTRSGLYKYAPSGIEGQTTSLLYLCFDRLMDG